VYYKYLYKTDAGNGLIFFTTICFYCWFNAQIKRLLKVIVKIFLVTNYTRIFQQFLNQKTFEFMKKYKIPLACKLLLSSCIATLHNDILNLFCICSKNLFTSRIYTNCKNGIPQLIVAKLMNHSPATATKSATEMLPKMQFSHNFLQFPRHCFGRSAVKPL